MVVKPEAAPCVHRQRRLRCREEDVEAEDVDGELRLDADAHAPCASGLADAAMLLFEQRGRARARWSRGAGSQASWASMTSARKSVACSGATFAGGLGAEERLERARSSQLGARGVAGEREDGAVLGEQRVLFACRG